MRVMTGPTPKITHLDFKRVLAFFTLIVEIIHLMMLNPFMAPFL